MTRWRLGWLVAPRSLVPVFEKLAQNLFICASTVAQRAALACFEEPTLALCEARRRELQQRRDFPVPALEQMGLRVPVIPDGAFYIYADVSSVAADSWDFAFDLLRNTGVCVVPGRDFGMNAPERYVRLSYATALPLLQQAVERMAAYLRPRTRA